MATSNSTTTPSLTPSQQAAREFWRQAGADGMPPFYVMSQYYGQLSANSDNLPVVTAALEQLLTGLGYATDLDTVFAELTAGQTEELGYWAGRYCLFDSDGNRFDLVVGRNGATLTVPPALVDMTKLPAGTDMASATVLSGDSFSAGVLQLANPQFLMSLRFTLPVSDATLDAGAAAFQSTAPLCTGTFAVVGAAAGSQPVSVNGRRGAWTQAGVNQAADGDPAAAWYGQYVLLDVTEVTAVVQAGGADAATAPVVQVPELVYLYNDPSFGLTFQWGNRYGSNVTYNNNVLQCADEDNDATQYAMQFVAPQAGAAELNLAVNRAGVVRSYKGYWVGRYSPPRPVSQARLAKRPMMAVYSSGSDASGDGYSQAVDMGSLNAGAVNKIGLPYGAVGNTYALTLNMTGCAATDEFSWTVSDDPTGRASIAPGGGANQTILFSLGELSDSDIGHQLQVTVQLTKTSAAPPVAYTLVFDFTAIQGEAITLEPPLLPPVVVGAAYSQSLAAYGARGNFTWSADTSSLPPGLTWNSSSHQLSGSVTDATEAGKALSLGLGLTASDVIMDPLTTSLPITVQSGAAVASGIPSWANILIYASPAIIALTAIAALALKGFLEGKVNPKNAEAIRVGNTNIEDVTNGNPRLISQSIVRAENATLPFVKEKISNYEKVIKILIDKGEKIYENHSKSWNTLTMLSEYLEQHPSDNPNDPVRDRDLNALGYETYQQIKNDIPRLDGLTAHYMRQWHENLNMLNATRTMSASDRKLLDDTSDSESCDSKLLED
jgi:hypothetical protein